MQDILTYVPDINTFRAELATLNSDYVVQDESGDYKILLTQARIIYSGDRTLTLCRVTPEQRAEIEAMTTVEIIGEDLGGDDFEFETGGRDKYELVYSTAEQNLMDEQGNPYTYTPPKKFCVFAA